MTTNGTQSVQSAVDSGSEDISFAELFEQEDHNTVINVGEVAMGTVVGIDNEMLLIDVGDKAEAIFPFPNSATRTPTGSSRSGTSLKSSSSAVKMRAGLLLSREKAIAIKVWEDIAKIQEEDRHH